MQKTGILVEFINVDFQNSETFSDEFIQNLIVTGNREL